MELKITVSLESHATNTVSWFLFRLIMCLIAADLRTIFNSYFVNKLCLNVCRCERSTFDLISSKNVIKSNYERKSLL
jgi:hypothetical protein